MAFMQKQVTKRMMWIEIDGHVGTEYVPAEDCPKLVKLLKSTAFGDAIANEADQYYGGNVYGIEAVSLKSGFGARLSAPGYMDCTEWTVFDTEAEAQAYLDETYPDDDEDQD